MIAKTSISALLLSAALIIGPALPVQGQTAAPGSPASVTANGGATQTATTTTTTTVGTRYVASPISIPSNGGQVLTTTNAGSVSSVYANVQQGGNPSLSGIAVFEFTQNGIIVSETGVPASAPVTSGRIYVNVNGPVNTGIAFANPNQTGAVISFYFTDLNGNTVNQGSFTLNGYSQIAAFMNQAPFNASGSMEGTFTFTSSGPVGAIALRGLINQRGEFIMSTLPVSPLPATPVSEPVVLPQFADGGGWTTQIILTNLYDTPVSGQLQFFGPGSTSQPGPVLTMTVNGVTANSFSYTIQGRSSARFVTAGNSTNGPQSTQVGSVQLTSNDGLTPTMSGVFSYNYNGITVTEAGISAAPAGVSFQVYGVLNTTDSIQSGVALANPSASPVTVSVQAVGLNATPQSPVLTLTLPAKGQLSQFIGQLFPSLTAPFEGFFTITASAPIGVTALRTRYNTRNDFLITTTPARDNNQPIPGSGLVFPDVVAGGGYTSEVIIFGGPAAAGSLWVGSTNSTVITITTTTNPPTITGFTPGSGPTGTSVTISGTNFTGATAVLFNGVSASFTVSSATAIQASVPAGATTGPLTVTTLGGTATSASSFTVNACGVVVSGTVTLTANVISNLGIVGVQFSLDNANLGSTLTTSPYSLPWNTTTVPNGCHTVKAVATDTSGSQGTALRSVTVNN